jgi:hypothetical protein
MPKEPAAFRWMVTILSFGLAGFVAYKHPEIAWLPALGFVFSALMARRTSVPELGELLMGAKGILDKQQPVQSELPYKQQEG